MQKLKDLKTFEESKELKREVNSLIIRASVNFDESNDDTTGDTE